MAEVKEAKIEVIKSEDFKSNYSNGAMGCFTNYDLKLAFYFDRPKLNQPGTVERIVTNEMILSPLAVLQLSNWLLQQLKAYEAMFGPISNGNPANVQKSVDNPQDTIKESRIYE
jgi:hypothetical protein